MALFEFEDGHLVPAQFGYPVAQDLGPDLVDAICQQVLQIVSRPLFPVTWRDMTGQGDEETPRLTALDVSGQIVSVEILKELDSETLITSLSRLAEVASISWSDLAAEYPSGPEGFRGGWAQFRDSMPPAVGPGPRLIIVAGEIDPSVRPALSILATSGVEVHLMNLRQMSNGRLFLDVNAVGPRLYGHAPQLLASAAAAPALAAATEQPAPFEERVPAESAIPAPPEEGAEASNEEDSETPTTRPTPKVAPHLREVFTYPIDEEPPAPWQSAAEEGDQDEAEAELADALEAVDAPQQGEPAEQADATEESADEWAPADEADDADEAGEADAPDAADQHVADHVEAVDSSEVNEAVEEVADARDAFAPEFSDSEHAEEAEAEIADALDTAGAHEQVDEQAEASEGDAAEQPADKWAPADEAGEADAHAVDDQHADDHLEEIATEESVHADEAEAADERSDESDEHVEIADEQAESAGDATPEQADEQQEPEEEKPRWERPAHMSRRATRRAREESVELNDGGATEAATASSVDRSDESPEVAAARAEGLPVLGRDEAGLRTLAQILGQDTPLVARSELGLPTDLVLAASGAVSGAGLTYPSLDTLLTARGLGHLDAWGQVRIGDRLGPTLAEALDEVNREIVREYAQAPRGHRSAKH
ncbi:hypothetical protein QP500_08820 [Pauljensenia sp. UMB0018B]|uniref:Uncharacterized protein n=1 Tax=Schaalia odontolytica TaxID=1660 RepID=A0A2I1I2B7_9ACTO|nr:hypothetical protein [Schaalia odontolytica]MDK7340548.1 hypothetical protein [Pauljensenia sp. UMB0018B]PKY65259.1 hypothetical protein CYJ22_01905 [Schaalia odontolytica]